MIDDYRGLAVFVAVADAGSFSAAGRRLKLSTPTVSHHVSKLEKRMGVSLFFRSTRSLSLTSEGQRILGEAKRMVNSGETALDLVSDTNEQPVGSLRITLPAFGEQNPIHKAIWEFALQYPMVAISLQSSGKQIDLVKGGFDLAIRLGALRDSSLKSRKLGEFRRVIVASPQYLSSLGRPITISNLADCTFVSLAMLRDEITLYRDYEQATIKPENAQVEVDAAMTAKGAVIAGLGLRALPVSEIEAELNTGELIQVLPEWRLASINIYAVWPDIGQQKKLTRRMIDFLVSKQLGLERTSYKKPS